MVPQRIQREHLYVQEQPRRQERKDVRLEWRMHVPFTPKKKEKKYILVEETAPTTTIFLPRPPPSPPLTPVHHIRPNVVPISPRLPVREHQERIIAPARDRTPERLDLQRQNEARRLAGQRAALDAHIEGLRAEQARREAEREEARRTRAHEARLREINEAIAGLEAQLASSERRRRRAEGNRIHQTPLHERRRHEDNVRDRQDFRIPRQDAGGGGIRAGEAGLGGGRHARQRPEDREIRNLERRFEEERKAERRRRKRETLGSDPNAGRRQDNPFRQPWDEFTAGVRINNKNGRART